MSRYHINPETGNVAPCGAKIKCAFDMTEDEHYPTKESAARASEELLEERFSKLPEIKGIVVPHMPAVEPVTIEECQAMLDRTGRNRPLTQGNVVGFSLMGSVLYGLNTADSDRDVLIVTDKKAKRDFHHVYEDGMDVRVASVFSVASRFLDSQPTDVDLLQSGAMTIDDNNYAPYLNGLRFNEYTYMDKVTSHAMQDTKNGMNDSKNEKRANKSLKTALRNFVLHEKVYEYGLGYSPRFTDNEREKFYAVLDEVFEAKSSLDTDSMIEFLQKRAPKIL